MDTATTCQNRHDFQPGGPEIMFGVDELSASDTGFRASMVSGPWSAGPANAAAVGVLADNVLGYALISSAPLGRWSVSTEISLDFVGPLPADGTRMSAEARVVHASPGAGLAEGSLFSSGGQLVARCRQWGRFIEATPQRDGGTGGFSGPCRSVAEVTDAVLGDAPAVDGRAWFSLPVEDDLVNPLRTLHGGVTLWLAELLACRAVDSVASGLVPASLAVSYLRPFVVGDVATFRAEVTSRGRRLAVTQVTGLNEAGKPCIVASAHHHGPG
ncbi:PaaI family thioesterase [Amycolatopsis echigonensis]|uniref:PaaI family thioesterase n=1 Tax=Amycolatopsis echigonensis TaxID=2576905 RepID=A0A8E1W1T3_9PSEU|nr:PaaI family thioesterase [Amycolatopsis echigonensis]MBB2502296.1 PaaI family thioesterase [Amycolatopsis echigonensis]